MRVDQILQSKGSKVHTISAEATVAEAVRALNAYNIGALVVTEANGRLAGILSERDVVRRLVGSKAAVLTQGVKACMTPDPITCAPDDTTERLMGLMTTHRIRHLPVVKNGKLIGLISIGDVVKSRIEEVEHEAAALRDYIAS
ncbi:MAG: CBS domain-containing protein [Cucumibacter sp.]